MERSHLPPPQKSSSFSFSSSREEKLRQSDRNLSLGSLHFHPISELPADEFSNLNGDKDDRDGQTFSPPMSPAAREIRERYELMSLSDEIDRLLDVLKTLGSSPEAMPEIPDIAIFRFGTLVEEKIVKYECGIDQWSTDSNEYPSFLHYIDRASKLTSALSVFCEKPQYFQAMNQMGVVVHRAMSFLEDEFHSLLVYDCSSKPLTPADSAQESPSSDLLPSHPDETTTAHLKNIASSMIAAGYEIECYQIFIIARRNALDLDFADHGFDKVSIDDVLRMPWESLETEISAWKKAFNQTINVSFPRERRLCETIFGDSTVNEILCNIARGVLIQFLTFAEAITMTKPSAEKLFRILDMYESLGDIIPKLDIFLTPGDDIKFDLCAARNRLGEAALYIFSDLETSIRSDLARVPVPGGAVHPLTRYVMNYLKYACEYKNTLERAFQENNKKIDRLLKEDDDVFETRRDEDEESPFTSRVAQVMELLDANLVEKAKLYKDPALSSIFMMNNGRYIAQKVKGSAEVKELLGETWCRKKSSDLRQHHKNYQRETWSKVLGCFKDEGLQVRGSVLKPVLKERFKSFNAMFEEIHRTQSAWVVCDEQLQSELRVSVSAVVVPAYRSFLGRFSHYLDPGRQTEKYIKFGAEDLEAYIEDLFDGNSTPMPKRKS